MSVAGTEHRRDQLLDIAARLFSRRGYHGTSMQHLAEAMGILRGSIYAHISSKEDLLYDIVDRVADRFISRMEEIVASDTNPEVKVRRALLAHMTTVAEHLEASTVLLNEWRFLSGDRHVEILAKRDLYESLVREIVEEGVEWGAFPEDLDAQFASILILSIANWLYHWYDQDGDLTPEEIAGRCAGLVLGGLKGES